MGKVYLLMLTNRRSRRRSVVALLVAALAAVGLYAVPAANAAYGDPGPVKLRVSFNNGPDKAGDTVTITGVARAADDSTSRPSGTMTFSVGDGVPVPTDQYGNASIDYVIPSNAPFDVTVTFHGTNGWVDNTATGTFTPLTKLYWGEASPTVATISGGLPKLTLKFSTYRRNGIGEGIPGRKITFSLFAQMPMILAPSPTAVPVCTAVTDANGYASCSGLASLATLVSILNGGAWANDMGPASAPGGTGAHAWVKIPAFKVG